MFNDQAEKERVKSQVDAAVEAAKRYRTSQPILTSSSQRVGDGVVLVKASDLTLTPIRWLWREWLALGKLHILAGAPGQGKTTIAIALAATVTSGGTGLTVHKANRVMF